MVSGQNSKVQTTCVREACPPWRTTTWKIRVEGCFELASKSWSEKHVPTLPSCMQQNVWATTSSLFQCCTQVSFRTAVCFSVLGSQDQKACFTATLTDFPFVCFFFFCKRHACFAVAADKLTAAKWRLLIHHLAFTKKYHHLAPKWLHLLLTLWSY